MNVLIETYRGYDIIFSTDNERFSFSTDEGSWNEKQSYAACKKNIDDFFKNNQGFIPFKVITRSGRITNIIGIRKDGRFISENSKKEKGQVSEWDEKDYRIYNPDVHDTIFASIASIEVEIDQLKEKRNQLEDLIDTPTLREFKRTLTYQNTAQ